VSFPDKPELFRTPSNFALHVAAGELGADEISEQLSNLLGFAKNFYLQFFKFEFGIEIRALDREARRSVRPVERRLRKKKDAATSLRLISQFVTLVKFLEEDEATEYDSYDMPDRRRRILEDVAELLDRIADWSGQQPTLPRLAKRCREVCEAFANAIEWIDTELGYEDASDQDD
jgi:hypothetical protein